MLTNNYTQLLPGFEDLHVGLRLSVCECGCQEEFWQTKVGRSKKYINATHKARAYRNKRKEQSEQGMSAADLIAELKLYVKAIDEREGEIAFAGMTAEETDAFQTLCWNAPYELGKLMDMMSKIAGVYIAPPPPAQGPQSEDEIPF